MRRVDTLSRSRNFGTGQERCDLICGTHAIPEWPTLKVIKAGLDHPTSSAQPPRDGSETDSTSFHHAREGPRKPSDYHTDSRTPAHHQSRLTLIPAPFRPSPRIRKHRFERWLCTDPFFYSSVRLTSGDEITETDSGGHDTCRLARRLSSRHSL